MSQAAVATVPAEVTLTKRPGSNARVPELDGIRAIAIWMVMICHLIFNFPNPPHAFDRMPGFVHVLLDHGWLGVDLFFVLSGFLITGILLDTKDGPRYATKFYGRRLLRIFPLYILCTAVLWLFYPNSSRYALLSLFFLANFAHPLHVHEPDGMGMLWSLNVEEHFYLLWPWLVLLLSRKTLTYLAWAIVLLSPVLRLVCSARGMEIYYYSWFRLDGLATGALIAIWARSDLSNKKSSLRLAAGLIGAAILLTLGGLPAGIMKESPAGHAFRFTQANCLFGSLLIAVLALLGSPLTALFRINFMVLAGELSYCLYLVHFAIGDAYMVLTRRYSVHMEQYVGDFGSVLVRFFVVIACSYLLALFSRTYIERPFLRMKKYF